MPITQLARSIASLQRHTFESVADIPATFDWRWPNFTPREVACKGTGRLIVVPEYLDLVQRLRDRYGRPLAVSSWYRTPEYNVQVSSTGPDGPHTTGLATDFTVQGADALRVLRLALDLSDEEEAAGRLFFSGVGVKQHAGGRFLHLDALHGTRHPRPWLWSYA